MSSSLRLFKLHVSGWNDIAEVKLLEIWSCHSMSSGLRRKFNSNDQEALPPLRDAGRGLKPRLLRDWPGAAGLICRIM